MPWCSLPGFGIPLTAFTYFLSLAKGTALFSLLFPVFVMAATKATPVPCDPAKSVGKLCTLVAP